MPLLDYHTFASSLQRWENSLKKINKKISEYELQVNNTMKWEARESSKEKGKEKYVGHLKNIS